MPEIVRAGALHRYARLVASLGGDPAQLLRRAGLSLDQLADPDAYISYRAHVRLLDDTAHALACPDFGLRLGALQGPDILGALAVSLRHAATLRDVIHDTGRYLHFHTPSLHATLEPAREPDCEAFCMRLVMPRPPPLAQVIEHAMRVALNVVLDLTRAPLRVRAMHFEHAQVSPVATYREHFGVEPRFGAERNDICFASRDLETPIAGANRAIHEIAARYLETNSPPTTDSDASRVHFVLARMLRSGDAAIDEVARSLGLHVRALQRRLQAEGTSFERVKDDVRRETAAGYLREARIPLKHVASLLGYSEPSALSRSCRRWFGASPREIRARSERSTSAGRIGDNARARAAGAAERQEP